MTEHVSFRGTESFLVGLSPTYWSHVPLCIAQIHQHLVLVEDGVHCLVVSDNKNASIQKNKLIPISRCRVVGCIVSVERKSSGATFYILDDGTGLLDCLAWEDSHHVQHALPPLVKQDSNHGFLFQDSNNRDNHQNNHRQKYKVGDIVELMGRIECAYNAATAASSASSSSVLRELHVTSIRDISSQASRATPGCMDGQSRHMLQHCSPQLSSLLLHNGVDVLKWLGPNFATQVAERQHFPAADDTAGAWRLFGSNCPCVCDDLKTEVLYCHCIAKPLLDLDPDLVYRDAMLRVLLQMEEKHNNNKKKTDPPRPLLVQYQELATDSALIALAQKQIQQLGRPESHHAKLLLLQTVRSLRDDGILYLWDAMRDIYLFLTRSTVLEPYIRLVSSSSWEDAIARDKLKKNMPAFLRNVPKARLQLVRRTLGETTST